MGYEEDDDWFDELEEIVREEAMCWLVYCDSMALYRAKSLEDAQELKKRIVHGNRWASLSYDRVIIHEDQKEPDEVGLDELELAWKASIQVGQAGWNLYPFSLQDSERINEEVDYVSATNKEVYVKASSALAAIERARYLLIKGGHKYE